LRKRLASAAVLIPIVATAVFLGGLYLAGLIAAVTVLAVYEYQHLVQNKDSSRVCACRPCLPVGILLALLLVADGQWPHMRLDVWSITAAVLGLLAVGTLRGNTSGALSGWAHTIAGSLYVGLPMGLIVRLRNLDNGLYWVLLVCIGTWMCDTASLFVGKAWGHRPFFPSISPSKTWEGAIGGEIVGAILVTACSMLLPTQLPLALALALGVSLPAVAIFGDLAESLIKRQIGVKDSGRLIPGHGGMLDRIDSLLFAGPMVYAFVMLIS